MTDAEKIVEIRKHLGITWRQLAENLGVASPQTFVDIRSGRHGISERLRTSILAAYPEISKEWLLTDSGPMLKAQDGGVTLFGTAADVLSDAESNTNCEQVSFGSFFPGATLALRYNGDDMVEYPKGCTLALKPLASVDSVIPGTNYLVVTDNFASVKRVQSGLDGEHIALYSTNMAVYPDGKMIYEPYNVAKEAVKAIYSIEGYIVAGATELTIR